MGHWKRTKGWVRRHPVWAALVALVLLPVTTLLAAGAVFWHTSGGLGDYEPRLASRLYARQLVLEEGRRLAPDHLASALEALDYREVEDREANLTRGTFRSIERGVEVRLRDDGEPRGEAGSLDGIRLRIFFEGETVSALEVEGMELEPGERLPLGRPLLHDFPGATRQERRRVSLEDLPEHVVRAVLAAEDAEFFQHPGLSLTGIARAAWMNLRAGEIRQGGSTITQQLVKNLYLDPKRQLARKSKEAVLALLTEARFGKRRILEAYLNEIYWGSFDGVQLMGLGAAARSYFGKDAAELSAGEAATLAGMIQAPGDFSPLTRPEAARERRNRVLENMAARQWLAPELAEALAAEPISVRPTSPRSRRVPYFAAFAQHEAARRFGVEELGGSGCRLFSTLDLVDQLVAEEAVHQRLPRLEASTPKAGEGELQAALVSLDPSNGEILAYVGGRDYSESQFDRASKSRRQAGSAFKPVVFAAAVSRGFAHPHELVLDTPILVKYGTRSEWRPRNSDRSFRGPITVRSALEESRNIPAIRLAISAGLDRVRTLGRDMGIRSPLGDTPSLALGAFEVSTLELATVYATLASGGLRPTPHGLEAIEGCDADPAPLPDPERVLHFDTAFLVTSMLQGSMNRGTAWRARRMGVEGPFAGKTGTSDDHRDAWFAGYSPDRTTVVWVGLDENRSFGLSGAEAALPLWADFVTRVAPPGGSAAFETPPSYRTVTVDPATGHLATPFCPRTIRETLPPDRVPFRKCEEHRPELDAIPFGALETRSWTAVSLREGDETNPGSGVSTIRWDSDGPRLRADRDPIELFRQRQQNPGPQNQFPIPDEDAIEPAENDIEPAENDEGARTAGPGEEREKARAVEPDDPIDGPGW